MTLPLGDKSKILIGWLQDKGPMQIAQLRSYPELLAAFKDGRQMSQTVTRLASVGHLVKVGRKPAFYSVPMSPLDVQLKPKKTKKGVVKKPASVPVSSPAAMKKLNLRIHQSDKALSFDIEGWSIKISFEA